MPRIIPPFLKEVAGNPDGGFLTLTKSLLHSSEVLPLGKGELILVNHES
jgi:hypothetical protein